MLSRKIIILKSLQNVILAYDYQYNLSKEIYHKITLFDDKYAKMLHDEGFRSKDKKLKIFKLFNFALRFENKEMNSKGIRLSKDDNIELVISGSDKVINAILQGLIIDNRINIDNMLFEVEEVKNDKYIRFNKINIYKTITPVVESVYQDKIWYLNPYQIEYYNALKQNLNRKYEIIYNKKYDGELKLMIEDILKIKKKTFNIKEGYVQGYAKFEILIQADKDMQKVAYYCGLGQGNSMGAGFLDYITGGE